MRRIFGLLFSLAAGCGVVPMEMPVDSEITTAEGDHTKWVVNKLTFPMLKTDYAIDLNGDGKAENQLGSLIGTLASAMIDAQGGIDGSVAKGQAVVLFDVQSTDAMLKSATNVGVTVYKGKDTTSAPKFDGKDTFTIDPVDAPAPTYGKLTSGKYSSNLPPPTKHPVKLVLRVPILGGGTPVALPLNGAHVQFQGSSSSLMSGQIHGSLKKTDVDMSIIPAIAKRFEDNIHDKPNDPDSKTLKMVFDVGDGNGGECTSFDGSKGKANDSKIAPCEVSGNALIGALFAPDVDIYDEAGNYAPNKANTGKDALSVGVAFTAVKASF